MMARLTTDTKPPAPRGRAARFGRSRRMALVVACLAIGSDPGGGGAAPARQAADPLVAWVAQAGDAAHAVALDGDRALAGVGGALQVVDLAAPTAPRLEGIVGMPPGATVWDIAVIGGRAFVAAGDAGLVVVDLATGDAAPQVVGQLPLDGPVRRVSAGGAHVLVVTGSAAAGGEARLHVVDVADPTRPRSLGQLARPFIFDVVGTARHAFLAAGAGGLRVIDIADPAMPREVAFVDAPGDGRGIAIDASRVYLAAGNRDLWIIDVSDPTQPAVAGRPAAPEYALDVAVRDGTAFVAGRRGGSGCWTCATWPTPSSWPRWPRPPRSRG